MISHQACLAALHMTDHMPFYTCLQRQRLDFRDSLFGIIFSQDSDTCFDGSLDYFQGLGLGHHYEPDCLCISSGAVCCICNLIENALIIFPNGGDGVIHKVIIIAPCGQVNQGRSALQSATCVPSQPGGKTSRRYYKRYKARKLQSVPRPPDSEGDDSFPK